VPRQWRELTTAADSSTVLSPLEKAMLITVLLIFSALLKGQCQEMNNFFKALKIKSIFSVYALMVFIYFSILIVKKNTL
jgi:hypothetical protein